MRRVLRHRWGPERGGGEALEPLNPLPSSSNVSVPSQERGRPRSPLTTWREVPFLSEGIRGPSTAFFVLGCAGRVEPLEEVKGWSRGPAAVWRVSSSERRSFWAFADRGFGTSSEPIAVFPGAVGITLQGGFLLLSPPLPLPPPLLLSPSVFFLTFLVVSVLLGRAGSRNSGARSDPERRHGLSSGRRAAGAPAGGCSLFASSLGRCILGADT